MISKIYLRPKKSDIKGFEIFISDERHFISD